VNEITLQRLLLVILAFTVAGCAEKEKEIAAQEVGGLAWSPLVKDFGYVNAGAESSLITFTLSNSSGETATECETPEISDTTQFTIVTNTCATNDLEGAYATCAVAIRAHPTSTGAKSATLSRTCTSKGTAKTTADGITVTGANPSLAWTPLTRSFGNIAVGVTSSASTFTLTNSGNGPGTDCSAPTISDATNFTITSDGCSTSDVASAGGSCEVDVKANPTSLGAKMATLSRTCTFGGMVNTTSNAITVTGVAPVITLAWSPLSHGFSDTYVGGNSATTTFTLTNSGNAPATGCSAPSISDTTNFQITTDNCATNSLNGSNATCTVIVRGKPTTTGVKTATLSRTCTTGGTVTTTANLITVTGVEASLAWTPLTHAFGNVNITNPSSSETFTLTNSGSGTAAGCAAPTITDTTNFSITADTCGTSNLGSTDDCTVNVRANPTTVGTKTATLSRTCTQGGTATTTTNQITAVGVQVTMAWSPLLKSFGNVYVGETSSSQTFTLTNSGAGTATGCTDPVLSDATNFSITTDTCGSNDLSGGSTTCEVEVTANPTTTGAKTATLSRTCTVGGVVSTTSNLITTTGVRANLAWTPLVKNFGDVTVNGVSSAQTFTLTNTGTASATGCSAPTISDNTHFTVLSDTCSTNDLASGSATCAVSIQANPTSTGLKTATLSRVCTQGGTVTTTAGEIKVTGTQIILAWSPATKAFGNIEVGSTSSAQTFTLTNSGNVAATGCAEPTISDTTNFTILSDTCTTDDLAGSSATCEVSIQANPASTGLKSMTLSRVCSVGGTVTTTANQITTTGIQPSLAWSPLTYGFGSVYVGETSSTQTFTLTNSGGASATSCSAPTVSDTTNFTITADTCDTNDLAGSNATCTVTVQGNPTSTGVKSTTLSRVCGTGGTASTTLNQITVTGVQATLAWSPLTKSFGNIYVGSTSSAQTFTLTNTGAASATGCSAPTITDTTNFTILTDTCSTSDLAGSASTCTVSIQANPTTTGAKTATLSRTCTQGGTASTTTNMITTTGVQASLAWSPLTRVFGNVAVGSNSATQVFTLTNSGTASATSCSTPAITDTTNFTITADTCSTSDLAGSSATCTVTIRGNPTSSGTKTTTLSRTCTVGGTASTTTNGITVVGTLPVLTWSPLTKDFGNVLVGSNSSTQVFTLTNSGNTSATGCSAPTITDTTNFTITADTCSTGNLAGSGATCTVTMRGNPTTAGSKTTTLSRTCTVGGTASTTSNQITVNGTEATLGWSPLTKAFGNVNVSANSSSQTFTLTNSGEATATGCSAPTITDNTNFTILTDTCSTSNLASSGGTCTVSIQGNPTTSGTKTTTLSRTCTVGGTVATTSDEITVVGVEAILNWSPMTHDFGSVYVGANSSTTVLTLTNSGSASATGCSAPVLTDTTNFTITADSCSTSSLAGSNATCAVTVRGNPTTSGAKSTTLSRTCSVGGTASTTTNQITVTGVQATLAWSPLTKDFGNVYVGNNSTTQTFTLTNSGSASATGCSAPTITDTTNFTITSDACSTSDLAGSSATCDVVIRGNPASTGSKTTTLSRTCSVGGTVSTTTNQITVTGVQATLAWLPLSRSFGDVYVGSSSSAQTFTLTNSGGASATSCTSPSITDTTNFTILSDTCATNDLTSGGATCTVSVQGNPTSTGAKTATLSRVCTVGGTASTTTNQITVTGVQASLAWSPLTYDFGTITVGDQSANQTFTLTNSGGASATGCSAPTITDTTNFTIMSDTCSTSSLAGGNSTCTVAIRANPASASSLSTTLSRTCSVGGTATTTTNQITVTGALILGMAADFENFSTSFEILGEELESEFSLDTSKDSPDYDGDVTFTIDAQTENVNADPREISDQGGGLFVVETGKEKVLGVGEVLEERDQKTNTSFQFQPRKNAKTTYQLKSVSGVKVHAARVVVQQRSASRTRLYYSLRKPIEFVNLPNTHLQKVYPFQFEGVSRGEADCAWSPYRIRESQWLKIGDQAKTSPKANLRAFLASEDDVQSGDLLEIGVDHKSCALDRAGLFLRIEKPEVRSTMSGFSTRESLHD
jgi:hypothetical protein